MHSDESTMPHVDFDMKGVDWVDSLICAESAKWYTTWQSWGFSGIIIECTVYPRASSSVAYYLGERAAGVQIEH